MALSLCGLVLWVLGYPDQALRRVRGTHPGPGVAHPFTWPCLGLHAMLHQFRTGQSRPRAGRGSASPSRASKGFRTVWRMGLSCGAGRWPSRDREKKELTRYTRVWPPARPQGQSCISPYFLALLAEAYGKAGQAEEGLATLAEALATVDRTGERFYEAELYRLKGELTLAQSGSPKFASQVTRQSRLPDPRSQAEAEACFLQGH